MKMARKQEGKRNNETKCKMNNISEEQKHKIIIISDSQTRGCAAEVKHNLNKNIESRVPKQTGHTNGRPSDIPVQKAKE